MLDFLSLNAYEQHFILNYCFEDVLKNLEVIAVNEMIFKDKEDILNLWNGNVIICNEENVI